MSKTSVTVNINELLADVLPPRPPRPPRTAKQAAPAEAPERPAETPKAANPYPVHSSCSRRITGVTKYSDSHVLLWFAEGPHGHYELRGPEAAKALARFRPLETAPPGFQRQQPHHTVRAVELVFGAVDGVVTQVLEDPAPAP